MPIIMKLRELTADERDELERLSRSRTAPAREVERAKILLCASRGQHVPAIAEQMHLTAHCVRERIRRFNHEGLAALQDQPRPGRPAQYNPEQVSLVVQTALTKPTDLGLPFAAWTQVRLQDYLNEQQQLPIKRSRIGELLAREGLRWREDETWFSPTVDPEFVKKRGRLNGSIPTHRRGAL
jgi:transposase